MQFRKIEPHAVEEHPEGAAPANEHRLPPPVVILSTQLDIGGYYGDFNDRDDVHNADHRQEAENVIIPALVLP